MFSKISVYIILSCTFALTHCIQDKLFEETSPTNNPSEGSSGSTGTTKTSDVNLPGRDAVINRKNTIEPPIKGMNNRLGNIGNLSKQIVTRLNPFNALGLKNFRQFQVTGPFAFLGRRIGEVIGARIDKFALSVGNLFNRSR